MGNTSASHPAALGLIICMKKNIIEEFILNVAETNHWGVLKTQLTEAKYCY